MNPLIHTQLNLDFLREQGLSAPSLVIAGGVLPDLAYLGALPEKASHEQGAQFLDYLRRNDPALAGLGAGFVLHGEQPEGLDWFTHNPKGYIARKKGAVADVVYRHHVHLGGLDLDHTTHCLTEFACDSLVPEHPALALNNAFRAIPVNRVARHLGVFFHGNEKKIARILHFLRHFDFRKLRTDKGVANVVQNYVMFQRLGQSDWSHKHRALIERLNLKNYFRIKKTLAATREIVREDCNEFLAKSREKMRRTLMPVIGKVFA